MMINELLNAWYDKLNGNISVPVYRINVPETEKGNYVIIRPEGGTGANDKRSLNDTVIIIVDVVTFFINDIDGSVCDAIDKQIYDLILPTPQGHQLTEASGMQILNVNRDNYNYLTQSGTKQIYRKISRWSHYIHNTN